MIALIQIVRTRSDIVHGHTNWKTRRQIVLQNILTRTGSTTRPLKQEPVISHLKENQSYVNLCL